MSLGAWGDEDPAHSLCAVDGCECEARAFEATCSVHWNWGECSLCPVVIDLGEAMGVPDPDFGTMLMCDNCYGDSQCEGE